MGEVSSRGVGFVVWGGCLSVWVGEVDVDGCISSVFPVSGLDGTGEGECASAMV